MGNNKILFLTLKIFSATGGIEKVNRVAGKVLYEMVAKSGDSLRVYSMHDRETHINNENYFPRNIFKAFGSKKILFVAKSIIQGIKSNVLILSHVNLLGVGLFVKLFSPTTKLVLFAHGIEVWKMKSFWKKYALRKCDLILPVSNYTRDIMLKNYDLTEEKLVVINNCLDPFIAPLKNISKNKLMLKRYGLGDDNFTLLTLSRLSSDEKYKGYDKVILCMSRLINQYPDLRYLVVGKYDEAEKKALDKMIMTYGLQKVVIFAGYVEDEELADHFNLADLYVMPSNGEGFGIVFIEAMFYGKPVIAGNKDGSVDALCDGKLGFLVNPDNEEEICLAIEKVIHNRKAYIPDQNILVQNFSYHVYQQKLQSTIEKLYKYFDTYKQIKNQQSFSFRSSARKMALDTFGILDNFKSVEPFCRNRIQFLYVHHIFKDEEKNLRELIEFLSKHHTFISYSDAIEKILKNEIDRPYICFSSDDGFKNNLIGAKVLEEYGIKACFFICPGIIEESNYSNIKTFCKQQLELPPVEFLNWNDIDTLLANGHGIGSHTMTHKNLTTSPNGRLHEEIELSYDILKRKCGEIEHFAYPYGRYFHINETARKIIFNTGYQSCTSAERGCHVQKLHPPVKEHLLIRRDHILLKWNLSHIKYFLRRNSLNKSLQHNEFPFSVS